MRLCIESRTDTIKRRGDVLAHRGGIRATAAKADFLRRREKAAARPRDALHHGRRQLTLPLNARHGRDLDLDPVKTRAHDMSGRLACPDLEVNHRAIAQIRPSARQAIGIVAVALEILAPGLAPERFRDCTAARGDW